MIPPPQYFSAYVKEPNDEGPASLLLDGKWCGHGEPKFAIYDIHDSEEMDWLDQYKHDSTTDHTSFGGTLSVEGLGVTFCFALPDWDELEGVQLYPQYPIKSL